MNRASSLTLVACDRFPSNPEPGIFYYSEEFRSSLHLCACGCGYHVVLPIKLAGWALVRTGSSFSLNPSVGNREFACRSHYLLKDGQIVWLAPMSDREAAASRARDADHISRLYQPSRWKRVVNRILRIFGLRR